MDGGDGRVFPQKSVLDAPDDPFSRTEVAGAEPLREALVFLRLELIELVHEETTIDLIRNMHNNSHEERANDRAYRETRLVEHLGGLGQVWTSLPPETVEALRDRNVVHEDLLALQRKQVPRRPRQARAMLEAINGLLARFCV